MARLVIVYAADDLEAASHLAEALTDAGHDATLCDPAVSMVETDAFEFVVWICTSQAIASRQVWRQLFKVVEDDRFARSQRKLVILCESPQSRLEATSQFPDMAEWPVFDTGTLAPVLDHLNSASADGAMEDLGFDDGDDNENGALSQQAAVSILEGRLVHRIPQNMGLGIAEEVEVRIGPAAESGLAVGIGGHGEIIKEDLLIVETMRVELTSSTEAFEIQPQSPARQIVTNEVLKSTSLSTANYGRWLWLVTPVSKGTHELTIRVAAVIQDSRGVTAEALLPDKRFVVHVRVSYGSATFGLAKWILSGTAGMIIAALVGAATTDYWWPAVKAWLEQVM